MTGTWIIGGLGWWANVHKKEKGKREMMMSDKKHINKIVHDVELRAGEIVLEAYTAAFKEFGRVELGPEEEAFINEEAQGLQRHIANFMLRVVLKE